MSKNLTDLTFLACTLYKRCKEFNFSLIFLDICSSDIKISFWKISWFLMVEKGVNF